MTGAPVVKRRVKRATARRLAIAGAVAVAAASMALLAYWLVSRHLSATAEQERAALELTAQRMAEEIAGVLGGAGLKLGVIADRAEVAAALRQGDEQALRSLAGAAGSGEKYLLKLRLLPPDTRAADRSESPPLTYASLDMLARAREGDGTVPGELHLVGTDDAHIVLLRPIESTEGELLGFVHGAFSTRLLTDQVQRLGAEGYLEVLQPVPGSPPRVLAANGSRPSLPAEAFARAPIPGTAWTLRFTGEPAGVSMQEAAAEAAGPGRYVLIAAIVLLLAALVAAGWIAWQRRRSSLAGESVVYQGAVRAIMEGAHPGLERLVPGLSREGKEPGKASAIDDRLEGEDITTFARPEAAVAAELTESEREDGEDVEDGGMFSVDGSGIEVEEADAGTPDAGGAEPAAGAAGAQAPAASAPGRVPAVIFRAHDIRGIAGETLTTEAVALIGRALGAEAFERGQQGIVVARDGRLSSPELGEALVSGLLDSGRDVIDIGCVPTPVMYFATHYLDTGSGVMITGSHNPGDYNGLKIVLDGQTLSGAAISAIRQRIEAEDFTSGSGNLQSAEMIGEYIRRVSEDVPVALGNALKLVVDCGNAVTGLVAPQLLRALGHDVVELYCDLDGEFPNHHPDPSQPENLRDLIDLVSLENADLGLAFDGDGDRLGVVDAAGNIIWPDRQLILLARDLLSRNPGAQIIYDVKCSRHLPEAIEAAGGKATMTRTGHSLIKAKMQETGALLAGEMSGHIFFKERWYGFDDAMYAAARLIEVLVGADEPALDVLARIPGGVATPELRVHLPEAEHQRVMQGVLERAEFPDGRITTLDGLRVDFPDGWGLIRASNTTPCLVLRFEGDDEAALERVQARFRELIASTAPQLELPF